MQFKDYYDILGVAKNASQEDIRKAYRKLARQYHPDVSKAPDAAARMAEINEANTVLGDPEKRAAYDTVGAQAWAAGARSGDDVRPPPGWNSGWHQSSSASAEDFARHFGQSGFAGGDGGEYSDFFEHLFGQARARAQSQARASDTAPHRGQDQHARIELELLDAYRGAERQFTLRDARFDAQGHIVHDERTLHVKIPAGVKEGQMIRLAGQGSPGLNGGPAGDVLLQVHLRPDPRWRVEGRDVTQKLRVSPWEAALGGEVQVHTPEGKTVHVGVPAGSGSGRKLRLKGRGIPASSASGQAGDLYLELDIAVPGAVTEAQKAAWQALAQSYPGFDPRRA